MFFSGLSGFLFLSLWLFVFLCLGLGLGLGLYVYMHKILVLVANIAPVSHYPSFPFPFPHNIKILYFTGCLVAWLFVFLTCFVSLCCSTRFSFRGDLPLDLCGARDLQVLSMDGLGGATGCRHEFVIPVTGVRLFNTLDGSVPPCLWQLRNLTLLHLASNGLTGSIMQQDGEAHGSSITHLSLGRCLCLCVSLRLSLSVSLRVCT